MSDPDELLHARAVPTQPLKCTLPISLGNLQPEETKLWSLKTTEFYIRDALTCLRSRWVSETMTEHNGDSEETQGNDRENLCITDAPMKFLQAYFARVTKKTHVIGREFQYINYNQYNRIAFGMSVEQSFRLERSNKQLISLSDFANIVELSCPNVPLSVLHLAAKIIRHGKLGDANVEDELPCFQYDDLCVSFMVFIYFQEFWIWFLKYTTKDYKEPFSPVDHNLETLSHIQLTELFSHNSLECKQYPNPQRTIQDAVKSLIGNPTYKYLLPSMTLLKRAAGIERTVIRCNNVSCLTRMDENSDTVQETTVGHFLYALFMRSALGSKVISHGHIAIHSLDI